MEDEKRCECGNEITEDEDVCRECREAEEEEMNAKDAVLAYCMGLLI